MKERLANFFDNLDITRLLYLIFIANLADGFLTLRWIDEGIATEANPLMHALLQRGEDWFLIGKIVCVTIACLILWKVRHIRSARVVTLVTAVAYTALIIFHLVGALDSGVAIFGFSLPLDSSHFF